jgi:hypothetical protein
MVRTVPTVFFALACALLPLLSPLFPSPAAAHGKSVSYSAWHLGEEGAQVSVRIALLELSRLGIPLPLPGSPHPANGTREVGRYLAEHLELITPDGPCTPTGEPAARPSETGWLRYRWSLQCPSGVPRTIRSRILLDQAPSHLHFARVTLPGGASGAASPQIVERVLTTAEFEWPLGTSRAETEPSAAGDALAGASFGRYVGLGVQHILSGWDHLAFVLALILLARSLGEVARLVTGFTVAHSLTLAFAVLGWVRVESGPVEALIGFSVALVALENGWTLGGQGRRIPQLTLAALLLMAAAASVGVGSLTVLTVLGLALFSASHFALLRRSHNANLHRVGLAFAFGLIHGFGFAGVLAEMQLPTERLASALLGFNVGVEVGQLAVVAAIWPVLALLRRAANGQPYRLFAELASAAVCAVGVYWFLVRSLAGA